MSFTKISVYIFSEKWLHTLKNIGYKTTRDWTSFLLCTVLVCQSYMHKNHERECPKVLWAWFSQETTTPRIIRRSKTWSCMELAIRRPKLATLKTVCYLIHMRRKPQLLSGTNVSNPQILLFWKHHWGHPAYIVKSLLVGSRVMLTCLWAVIPENSKPCYLNNSTGWLFSRLGDRCTCCTF